ncbi:GIY-YIG nuclease family protein, partial [Coraliomargarita sp. SDUM461003]
MFYVYVLQSQLDQGLYIAYAGNLRRRLFEHNTCEAKATSFRRPWKLIYYEAYVLEEVLEVADSV